MKLYYYHIFNNQLQYYLNIIKLLAFIQSCVHVLNYVVLVIQDFDIHLIFLSLITIFH